MSSILILCGGIPSESISSYNFLLLPDNLDGSMGLDGTLIMDGTQVLDGLSKRNRNAWYFNQGGEC
jgi:hypothetical protein